MGSIHFSLDYASFKANIAAMMATLERSSSSVQYTPKLTKTGKLLRPRPLTQALNTRDFLYHRLQTEQLEPADHAKLTRAWMEACSLVRELQGYGKPKSVPARNDPDAKPRKAKAQVIEPQ